MQENLYYILLTLNDTSLRHHSPKRIFRLVIEGSDKTNLKTHVCLKTVFGYLYFISIFQLDIKTLLHTSSYV